MHLRAVVRVIVVLAVAGRAEAQPAIAFTHVAVVDVEKGALRPDQTVVIEGYRIAASDDASRVPVPRGAHLVRARANFASSQ